MSGVATEADNNICPCNTPETPGAVSVLHIDSKMHANARHVIEEVLKHFPQVKQIWTWANSPDHNNGRCCDYMITIVGMKRSDQIALGNAIAQYHIDHANRLGLNWLIWNDRIYRYQNTNRGHGWDTYHVPPGGSHHRDHVHVEVEDKTYEPPVPVKPLPVYEVDPTKVDPINGNHGGLWRVSFNTGKNLVRVEPRYRFKVAEFVDKWGRKWALSNKGNLYAADYIRKVSDKYSPTEIKGLAKEAGFPTEALSTISAIALAESAGNADAHNSKPPDDSYGLWQINMLGKLGPARRKEYGIKTNAELFNAHTNAKAAYRVYVNAGRSFKPWSTFNNGTYKKFLQVVS